MRVYGFAFGKVYLTLRKSETMDVVLDGLKDRTNNVIKEVVEVKNELEASKLMEVAAQNA